MAEPESKLELVGELNMIDDKHVIGANIRKVRQEKSSDLITCNSLLLWLVS